MSDEGPERFFAGRGEDSKCSMGWSLPRKTVPVHSGTLQGHCRMHVFKRIVSPDKYFNKGHGVYKVLKNCCIYC